LQTKDRAATVVARSPILAPKGKKQTKKKKLIKILF